MSTLFILVTALLFCLVFDILQKSTELIRSFTLYNIYQAFPSILNYVYSPPVHCLIHTLPGFTFAQNVTLTGISLTDIGPSSDVDCMKVLDHSNQNSKHFQIAIFFKK